MRKGVAEVEAGEVVRAVPVAAVRAGQAREPVVAQAQQAERVRTRRLAERNRDQEQEVSARAEELRTLAGRATPLTRQTGHFRDGLRHKIRLRHRD